MNQKEIDSALDKSSKLDTEPGKHVLVNVEFPTGHDLQYFIPQVTAIFEHLSEWGDARQPRCLFQGPGILHIDERKSYSAFAISDRQGYIEAVRVGNFFNLGVSNSAAFQYSSPSPERARSVVQRLVDNLTFPSSITAIHSRLVRSLNDLETRSMMTHFDQAHPRVFSGDRFDEIAFFPRFLQTFKWGGWSLYWLDQSNAGNLAAIVAPGPVTELQMGGCYHILPESDQPDDFASVSLAIERSIQKGRTPRMLLTGDEYATLDSFALLPDAVRLAFSELDDRVMKIPYFNLQTSFAVLESNQNFYES